MRSLGWLKFRYICIHRLLCITHTAIHRGFPEYIAQSITIQSSNRSSRKCHIMKLVQQSTSQHATLHIHLYFSILSLL